MFLLRHSLTPLPEIEGVHSQRVRKEFGACPLHAREVPFLIRLPNVRARTFRLITDIVSPILSFKRPIFLVLLMESLSHTHVQ